MPDDDDDRTTGAVRTFTQEEVNRFLAEDRRRTLAKFADYDDLKAKAEAGDAEKGKIDQILEKLAASETRASQLEAAEMRRSVADELGLTAKQAGRLTGATRDDLLADGRDLMETMGIKPKGTASAGDGDNGSDAVGDAQDDNVKREQSEPTRRQRPREMLQSGAPHTAAKPEETDPLKLAALIPRR